MLYKRLMGLILLCVSFGMLLVLMMPGWSYIIAAFLGMTGFYMLFLC